MQSAGLVAIARLTGNRHEYGADCAVMPKSERLLAVQNMTGPGRLLTALCAATGLSGYNVRRNGAGHGAGQRNRRATDAPRPPWPVAGAGGKGKREERTRDTMTLNELTESVGLESLCALFGWQGGTIHQARAEAKRRLAAKGIVEAKDGELVALVIKKG